uniref:Uncharacterized protein n=1 Tax=Ditylenchus dipsaci TaxID=166011 RepID=A0A915EV76_9BILA
MHNYCLLVVLLIANVDAKRSLYKRNNEYGDAPKPQPEPVSSSVTKEEGKSASAPGQKPQSEGYGSGDAPNAVIGSSNTSTSPASSNGTEISTTTAKPNMETTIPTGAPATAAPAGSNNQYGDEVIAPSGENSGKSGTSSTESVMPEQSAVAVSQSVPEKAPSHSSGY